MRRRKGKGGERQRMSEGYEKSGEEQRASEGDKNEEAPRI